MGEQRNQLSIKLTTAIAAAASITGTARGTMHGSCLPLISSSAFSPFCKSTVFCFCAMDGVGLIAALEIIGIPSVIPPKIQPQLFVSVTTSPST